MLFNPAIAGLTFRQALARRRWIVVGLLAALPIVMAALIRIYSDPGEDMLEMIGNGLSNLILTVIVPIVALVLANSALGAEIDDGTAIYLLAKPIPRSEIVITKLAMTSLICIGLSTIATLGSGLAALGTLDATRLVLGLAAGAAVGSFLYCALFLLLGLITRRGMLIGLVYLVIWEGALSGLFTGTRVLSVRQYMRSITDAISTVGPKVFEASLAFSTAWVMCVVVAALTIALTIVRLRHFEIGQASG